MSKYQLTNEAALELDKIYEFSITTFGIEQAQRYVIDLHNTFELLADNPKLGRDCSYIKKHYRKHEHQRHTIYYKMVENGILIARLLGEKQNQIQHF